MPKMHYRYVICGFVIMLFVVVMGVDAHPATQTSSETIRQLADKNHFHFGAAASSIHFGDSKYKATLSREFNMLTPENEAKFCSTEPEQGQFDFREFDRLMDFADQNK